MLIEEVTRTFGKRYRIATVKMIHHPEFSIDTPGKDTARHAAAGAVTTVAAAQGETSFIVRRRMSLEGILDRMQRLDDWDLILVEGFRDAKIPKVKVGGEETVSDTVLQYKGDIGEVLEFVETYLKAETETKSPTTVRLRVNGKTIQLAKFVGEMLAGSVLGMVRKLKDVPDPKSIRLEVDL